MAADDPARAGAPLNIRFAWIFGAAILAGCSGEWSTGLGLQHAASNVGPLQAGSGSTRTNVPSAITRPPGFADIAGNALRLSAAQVDNTMQEFKSYIEKRPVADGAWRGEVHGGQRAGIVSDRRPTEARIRQ